MAGFAVTYDLQKEPWAQAADVAKLRASLKQVHSAIVLPILVLPPMHCTSREEEVEFHIAAVCNLQICKRRST